jgi:hypothetical protein
MTKSRTALLAMAMPGAAMARAEHPPTGEEWPQHMMPAFTMRRLVAGGSPSGAAASRDPIGRLSVFSSQMESADDSENTENKGN